MPGWIAQGFDEYAKRMPRECRLELLEIEPVPRKRAQDHQRALDIEAERLLAAVPKRAHCVALAINGQSWSTVQLAQRLNSWMASGHDVALLVGGADGLAPACLTHASEQWSLSPLTFPHPLVRVILAEQLYRAWSLLHGHPYHRQ